LTQEICEALFDYDADADADDPELSLKAGDRIMVTDWSDVDWFEGHLVNEDGSSAGDNGAFPATYVKLSAAAAAAAAAAQAAAGDDEEEEEDDEQSEDEDEGEEALVIHSPDSNHQDREASLSAEQTYCTVPLRYASSSARQGRQIEQRSPL
jgi:hypothetical protein